MAALDNTCLSGVIGLANCACPCFEDTAPDDYNESESGLYITDLVPMEMVGDSDKCSDPSNPWNMVERARERGKNLVMKDVRAGIMKRNQPTRKPFSGMIGERSSRGVRSLSGTYAGIRIWSPNNRGGKMHITRIGGVFDAVGSISVQIYDRFNQTHGTAVVLTTTAGGYVSTACDITLDLWEDGAENAQYWAVYTVNQGNLPRETRVFCPTCGRATPPTFSTMSPYTYPNSPNLLRGWECWAMVGGWQGDSISEFDIEAETEGADNYTNGLTITAEFVCDAISSLCLGGLDYSDPVALSFAHAYRYAAAIELAQMLIRSPDAMRSAAVAKEVLAVDIRDWWADYQKNVDFVAFNAPVGNSDCIFCKPAFSMSVKPKLP